METNDRLKQFARRVRIARAWRWAAIGGCVGAFAAALGAAFDALRWMLVEPTALGALLLTGVALGALTGLLWRVRAEDVADSVDRRAGLQNRVRTALGTPGGAFAEEVSEDAWRHLEHVRPRTLFPLRFGRWHTGVLALAAVAASLFLLGNTTLFLSEQKKADREALKKAAPLVERVARPDLDRMSDQEKKLDAEMKMFAKMLERARLDRPEALQKANELAQKMDELAKERFAKAEKNLETADKALERMMRDELAKRGLEDLNPSDLMRDASQAQSQMRELEQRIQDLENKLSEQGLSEAERAALLKEKAEAEKQLLQLKLSQDALDTFQKLFNSKEFREIMEMAKKLQKEAQAGQQGQQQLTPEQVKELEQRLEELAAQLKDPEKLKEYLDALREALKNTGAG